jgi:hypothetical protein
MSKFGSSLAERLYSLSLERWQSEELGDADTFGWYALFPAERSILHIDSMGFVYATQYESRGMCKNVWGAIKKSWYEFEREDDEIPGDYDDDDMEYA